MASFQSGRNEALKTCPYNPVHKLAPRRYNIHLNTCPDRYNKDMTTCPMNSGHRVHKDQLDAHIATCPDLKQFLKAQIHVESQAAAEASQDKIAESSYAPTQDRHNIPVKIDDDWSTLPDDDLEKMKISQAKLKATRGITDWRDTCFRDGQIYPLGTMGLSRLSHREKAEYLRMLSVKVAEKNVRDAAAAAQEKARQAEEDRKVEEARLTEEARKLQEQMQSNMIIMDVEEETLPTLGFGRGKRIYKG